MSGWKGPSLSIGFLILIILPTSCITPAHRSPFAGTWRVVLDMPGGGLPFLVEIEERSDGKLDAAVRNGSERLPFTTAQVEGDTLVLDFAHYDSALHGRLDPSKKRMVGKWSRYRGGDPRSELDLIAYKDARDRFPPLAPEPEKPIFLDDVSGRWKVVFGEGDDAWESLAILEQEGSRVEGTFLTTVGDFRFLAGSFEQGRLRLSIFDGAHAFLFIAEAGADGTLKGDWWYGSYGTPWVATPAEDFEMPDPWSLTKITNEEQTFSFRFPDLVGREVSSEDPRFQGKALVACILGTWCPNCHDAGALMKELYAQYHGRGLEMVCLACEFAGDFERDKEMMRRFAHMYGITWPMLHVGSSSKEKTSKALPDLDRMRAYPTWIFTDKKGKVRRIYTGFNGPGTGPCHEKLLKKFRDTIEKLLESSE